MSILPPELPVSYTRGFVVGQVIHAIADTAPPVGDADRFPESRPATGSITFTPVDRTVRKVLTDPSTFVVHEAVTAQLGTTGELVDAQGEVGIWLVTGPYRVEFKLGSGASIPGFTIEVTAAHTPASPLDLVTVAPYTPPAGTTVTTLLVPAGPAEGQVLGWASGALTWVSAPPPGAHTHDERYYTESEMDAALAGKASSTHNHTGIYAPALGPDDNYVTDAEKAALHTHPAVIAQGATAAAARTAIGAGTSSLVIGTGAGDAKAGNYEPDLSALLVKASNLSDLANAGAARTNLGLGTAATTAATDYATAAQGTKADTALQPATGQAINAQTGTAYTLVAGDAGKLVTLTNAAAITLTVPGNVFTAGQRVDCIVAGAGMATAVGSSCTVNGTPSLVSRSQWSAFTVLFTSATTAIVVGDLA